MAFVGSSCIVPQLIHVTYPQIDRQRNNEIHQFWLDRFIIRRNPKKQQVLKPSNIKLKLLFAPEKKMHHDVQHH